MKCDKIKQFLLHFQIILKSI